MARGYILNRGKTRDILLGFAALGGIIALPGASRFFYSELAKLLDGRDPAKERAIRARRLKDLANRRLISIRDISGSKVEVSLTGAGKKLVKLYELDKMELPKPPKWDKKWRVITYDIPQKNRKASMALSAKFHQLGMFRLQKSIWIYPHECRDEIDAICAIFELDPEEHVMYLVTDRIPRETDAREHFDLAID